MPFLATALLNWMATYLSFCFMAAPTFIASSILRRSGRLWLILRKALSSLKISPWSDLTLCLPLLLCWSDLLVSMRVVLGLVGSSLRFWVATKGYANPITRSPPPGFPSPLDATKSSFTSAPIFIFGVSASTLRLDYIIWIISRMSSSAPTRPLPSFSSP